jgi:hypothetical protein
MLRWLFVIYVTLFFAVEPWLCCCSARSLVNARPAEHQGPDQVTDHHPAPNKCCGHHAVPPCSQPTPNREKSPNSPDTPQAPCPCRGKSRGFICVIATDDFSVSKSLRSWLDPQSDATCFTLKAITLLTEGTPFPPHSGLEIFPFSSGREILCLFQILRC